MSVYEKNMKYISFEVACKTCEGYGGLWHKKDGTERKVRSVCVACSGTGIKILKIPRVAYSGKCPHCKEFIGFDHYMKKAMKMLQGHSQDLTHWAKDRKNFKFGIDAGNTRFVETIFKEEPRIELFNTYMERYRVGNYHGYWTLTEIHNIVDYLQKFMYETGNIVVCDKCHGTGKYAYTQKFDHFPHISDVPKIVNCPVCLGRGTKVVKKEIKDEE